MKVLKQPLLWIAVVCVALAITTAVVSTKVNPSSDIVSKFEKALNKNDLKLLKECFTEEQRENFDETFFTSVLSMFEEKGKLEYEFLIGKTEQEQVKEKEEAESTEDGTTVEKKTIPAVLVIKSGDKILYIEEDELDILIKDGKEYIQ